MATFKELVALQEAINAGKAAGATEQAAFKAASNAYNQGNLEAYVSTLPNTKPTTSPTVQRLPGNSYVNNGKVVVIGSPEDLAIRHGYRGPTTPGSQRLSQNNPYNSPTPGSGVNELNRANEYREKQQRQNEEEYRSILAQINNLEANAGYITTPEQSAEHEAQRKAAIDRANELAQILNKPVQAYDARDRMGAALQSSLFSSAGAYSGAARALFEKGQDNRTAMYEEERAIAEKELTRAKNDYQETLAYHNGNEAHPDVQASKNTLESAQRKYDAFSTVLDNEVQQKAAAATSDIANQLIEKGNEKYLQATEGASIADKVVADAVKNTAELATDAAAGFLAPGAAQLSLAARIFGSSVQEAEADGATIDEQVLYGGTRAAKEVILNKLLGGLGKVYGKSKLAGATDKLWAKVANNPTVANALKIALNTEGFEEIVSASLDPSIRALTYSDKTVAEEYSEENLADWLYAGLMGQLLGSTATGFEVATNPIRAADLQNAAERTQNAQNATGDIQTPPTPTNASTGDSGELNNGSQQSSVDMLVEMATGNKKTAPDGAESTAMDKKGGFTQAPDANSPGTTPNASLASRPQYEATASGTNILQPPANVNPLTVSSNGQGGTERIRGFETNVATSSITDPELKARVEADIQRYKQLGNVDTLQKAQDIMMQGVANATATIQKALGEAQSGKKLAPEMVPLSRLLANELTRNGDVETARQILADVAVELTAAGQLGQAARILRTADPETARRSIQHALDKINAEFSARHANSNWQAALTETEEQLIANTDFTKEGAYEQVYKQIAKRIGAEMPSSTWEKLTEIRRINMLLNPRTVVKNTLGNVPMVIARKGAEAISAGLQRVLPESERTRGFANSAQRQIAREYFAENKMDILGHGDKWDINSLVRDYKTVFKNGPLEKALSSLTGKEIKPALEGMRQLTYKALEAGDVPFVRSAFVDSLAQFMAAKNISDINGITQEAIDFATKNAMEATFKNANVVSKALNEIKRNANPAVSAALDVLFPFTTTPTNIFAQTVKYSPVGLATGLSNALFNGANASNIDAISRGAMGSALLVLGYGLRNMGLITGGEDEDKDKAALDKATGQSPYSFGGKWSYDWAQPVGSLLSLGAEISDAVNSQETWGSAMMNALYTAGDSLLYMSLFQNIINVLEGTGKPSQQILDSIVEGGATQLVPGIVGAIAKIIDPTVRSTYTGGNVFDDVKAKVTASIPGLSFTLPESVNVKGEVQTRGTTGERVLDILAAPWNTNRNEPTAVDNEIYRIMEETGSKTHFPGVSPYEVKYDGESYKMTGEERAKFQTTQGQTYQDIVGDIINNSLYKSASAEQQRDIIENVRDYALNVAKAEYLSAKDKEYELDTLQNNLSVLDDPAGYLVATVLADKAAKENGGTFNKNGAEAFKYYIASGMSNDDLSKLSENLGSTQKGIYDNLTNILGQDAANAVFTQVATADEYGDDNNGREIAEQVNTLNNLTDEQKMDVLETYLPPDTKKGKRDSTVLRYEVASAYGVDFDKWTQILKALDLYDEEGAHGDNNDSYNKTEFRYALGGDVLRNMGANLEWNTARGIYNSAADKTDAYDETAIQPAKPKTPSKAYRYNPDDPFSFLGLN